MTVGISEHSYSRSGIVQRTDHGPGSPVGHPGRYRVDIGDEISGRSVRGAGLDRSFVFPAAQHDAGALLARRENHLVEFARVDAALLAKAEAFGIEVDRAAEVGDEDLVECRRGFDRNFVWLHVISLFLSCVMDFAVAPVGVNERGCARTQMNVAHGADENAVRPEPMRLDEIALQGRSGASKTGWGVGCAQPVTLGKPVFAAMSECA